MSRYFRIQTFCSISTEMLLTGLSLNFENVKNMFDLISFSEYLVMTTIRGATKNLVKNNIWDPPPSLITESVRNGLQQIMRVLHRFCMHLCKNNKHTGDDINVSVKNAICSRNIIQQLKNGYNEYLMRCEYLYEIIFNCSCTDDIKTVFIIR